MKNIFLTVLAISGILITTAAKAQEKENQQKEDVPKHELSAYVRGGYSPIFYKLKANGWRDGGDGFGVGGGGGLGYTYHISSSLGIVTGVEMSTYVSEAHFSSVSGKYPENADELNYELDEYQVSYSHNTYNEMQDVALFSVPVMVQYRLPISFGSMGLFVSGGFKLGFPIKVKAVVNSYYATVKGYFAKEDVEYGGYWMQDHGFLSAPISDLNSNVDLGVSVSLALETGVRFRLTDKIGLYTGLYLDYGLNNIQKKDNRHLLEYYFGDKDSIRYNSVLNTGFIDRINMVSAGLKVRIGFVL
jgi:hypothetical protein